MPTPNEGESQKDFVSRCIPVVLEDGTAEDNDQAVAVCNSMWKDAQEKQEENAMEPVEIARQAIETARAICNDSVMLNRLAEAKGVSPQQVANRMLDDLEKQLAEVTKTVGGKTYPASDFLVVEDPEKPNTWHLQVKENGKPNHKLMGGAKAALTSPGGHRGQKYAGPDKDKAIAKLKALYKAEEMPWEGETSEVIKDRESVIAAGENISGSLQDFANRVQNAFSAKFESNPRDFSHDFWTRDVFSGHDTLGDVLIVDENATGEMFAVGYTQSDDGKFEFQPRSEWKRAMLTYMLTEQSSDVLQQVGLALASHDATAEDTSNLTEAESAAIETGRRAPVIVDFQMIKPGPGNRKNNHYYPSNVLARDIHVFEGVDIFATDHKEAERSERTKVGCVLSVPVRFTEDKAPVARVLIYDPAQAEKTRNRADANALNTLECSIYGTGRAKPGKVDDVEYNVVEAITQGKYLELVSKAGAGGHALNLAENDGGETMEPEEQAEDTEGVQEQAQEVPLAEGEQAKPRPESLQALAEAEVTAVLSGVRLPDKVKALLAARSYSDKAMLEKAIAEMVEEFKEATGSGKPTVRKSQSLRRPKARANLAEMEQAQNAVNAKFLGTRREVGK